MTRYSRQDVLRILQLHSRQLVAWERSGLIAVQERYSFQDLVQFRKLRDLSGERFSAASIRQSVTAMQKAAGMENPLMEAVAVRNGRRIVFRHSGLVVDPIRNQFLFDFESTPQQLQVVSRGSNARGGNARGNNATAQQAYLQSLFIEAVALEESSRTTCDAMKLYGQILETYPSHAPTLINLGTLYYNQKQFGKAEELYRQATISDPKYALAFFDLGNVLDELKRMPEAVEAYKTAIELVPAYADAHYNLALAYERMGQSRRALHHWTVYIRLDAVGPWSNHARAQIERTLEAEPLQIVHRGTRPPTALDRAAR